MVRIGSCRRGLSSTRLCRESEPSIARPRRRREENLFALYRFGEYLCVVVDKRGACK